MQWVSCGWASIGWIAGDDACLSQFVVTPGRREKQELSRNKRDDADMQIIIKMFTKVQQGSIINIMKGL